MFGTLGLDRRRWRVDNGRGVAETWRSAVSETLQKLREHLSSVVQELARKSPEEEKRWEADMRDWTSDVHERLKEIRSWLKPLLSGDHPPLTWRDLKCVVAEGDGKAVEVDGARLLGPGGRFVEIVPKARHVFSATGRVDFVSPKGRMILARFDPGKWSFVWPVGEEWRSAPLSETTLAEVLREMLA